SRDSKKFIKSQLPIEPPPFSARHPMGITPRNGNHAGPERESDAPEARRANGRKRRPPMRSSLLLAALALIVTSMFGVGSANAQATRAWVSGVGDDANPCSRTAPCKTFAGAISKTAAGGEIDCLDPGGFGAVTITKSMTLDCSGTFGSILAAGTNGVN